jgi:hypothetical protein
LVGGATAHRIYLQGAIAGTSAALVALAGLVVLAALVGLVALAGLVVLGALVGLAALAGLVVLVGLVGGIACPPCRLGAATSGSTIRNIAAGPRIRIELQRTDSGARRGAILLPTVRLALGNRLADRAAICPAIGQVERAIDRVVAVPAIEPVVG